MKVRTKFPLSEEQPESLRRLTSWTLRDRRRIRWEEGRETSSTVPRYRCSAAGNEAKVSQLGEVVILLEGEGRAYLVLQACEDVPKSPIEDVDVDLNVVLLPVLEVSVPLQKKNGRE